MLDALNLLGLALQGVGLAVTGYGLAHTWQAADPTESMLGAPLRRAWAKVANRARHVTARLLGRRQDATIHAATGTATGSIAFTATAYGMVRRGGDLPDDPSEALARLDEDVRGIYGELDQHTKRTQEVAASVAAERQRTSALEARVEETQTTLDSTRRLLLIDGVRQEAVGLGIIGAGILLQFIVGVTTAVTG